jgi:hypothetical protein
MPNPLPQTKKEKEKLENQTHEYNQKLSVTHYCQI